MKEGVRVEVLNKGYAWQGARLTCETFKRL